MPWPSFTWDERVRQYRASNGRLVPRTAVRQALDEAIDGARRELATVTRQMQAGALNLPEWQLQVEANLKAIHVMSAAAAAGGWAQAKPADWSVAANRTKAAYLALERLARKLEGGAAGLDDGRLVGWVANLGAWGSGTYERVLRGRDLATGRVVAERRVRHASRSCVPCIAYEALGWQPPGTLPDIGTECLCQRYCRCRFQRRWAAKGGAAGGDEPPAARPARRPRQPARPAVAARAGIQPPTAP